MILDTLENIHRYKSLHPLFPMAMEYIMSGNWKTLAPGSYPVKGEDIKAIVIDSAGQPEAESIAKFECHNQYIDIQLCLSKEETIGWKPRGDCKDEQAPYSEERDVLFYNDRPDTFFKLGDGQFVVFFPEDVHAPMINTDRSNIQKLVMKIKV